VGDVGLGNARFAISTLWAIGALYAAVCGFFESTHGALVAAFRGVILEEASVAFDGVLPSHNGISLWIAILPDTARYCKVCKKGDLLQRDVRSVSSDSPSS
jgi:hypothetical protein